MANVLTDGLTAQQLALHPYCNDCGWRQGGADSWDGVKCKCGKTAPSFKRLFDRLERHEERADRLDPEDPDEEVAATYHAATAENLCNFLNVALSDRH